MKKLSVIIGAFILFSLKNLNVTATPKAKNFVPDEQTAIKVAEAIWLPIFGTSIYEERPFTAYLAKGVWHVSGTLPPGRFGGVAMIEIRKSDCKVLSVSHPK